MALEKDVRIDELTLSGSKAIKSIDPYGRHNYYAEQMKESNGSMDGEISGKLRRPKYDEEQLLLSVDTEVDELIPNKPKDLPDVVLQEDYDALQRALDAANNTIADLRAQLSAAQSKISELQSQISGLRAELDASLLRVTVAENSAEAAADKFKQTSIDLQQAIQKSVAEAIERVSLEAQVEGLTAQKEALVQQVSSLESQVAGVQAQLQAGGESAGGKWTARISPKAEETKADFYFYSTKKGRDGRQVGWRNGPKLTLLNSTTEPISFTFTQTTNWCRTPGGVTLQSGEEKTITIQETIKAEKNDRKKDDYNGTFTISGAGETVSFSMQNNNDLGSNKIICVELYRQGYLPYEIYKADEEWGDMLFEKDPKLIIGYQMWARKVVKFMRKNPQWTPTIYFLCKPWTEWMAYDIGVLPKNNLRGQFTQWVGRYFSYFVFDMYGGQKLLDKYNYKLFKQSWQ